LLFTVTISYHIFFHIFQRQNPAKPVLVKFSTERFAMKKISLLISLLVATLILSACGPSKRLDLTFNPNVFGASLDPGQVQLLIKDQRQTPLVGSGALNKDMFLASQSGLLDLTTVLPTGAKISKSQLSVENLVYEAVSQRLLLLGIGSRPDTQGAKARVTVNILEFNIDVSGSNIVSRISLEAIIDRPGMEKTFTSTANGESSKMKLVGDLGGSDTLGDALSRCVNNLNFTGLNSF
jgi:hypothetical protein